MLHDMGEIFADEIKMLSVDTEFIKKIIKGGPDLTR